MWPILLLHSVAMAGAVVAAVEEYDPYGVRHVLPETTASSEAWVDRVDGGSEPLRAGLSLEDGDTVIAHRAVVTLEPAEQWQVTLYQDSQVTIGEITWRLRVGQILCAVQDAFSVQTESFLAMVEGTKFLVVSDGSASGAVTVANGRVRVRNQAGEVLALRGDTAQVVNGSAPTLANTPRPARQQMRRLLRPPRLLRLDIGLVGGGRMQGAQPAALAEGMARLSLPGPVRLIGTLGIQGDEAPRAVGSAGLELGFDALSLGASWRLNSGTGEVSEPDLDAHVLWFAPAGSLSASGRLPLGAGWGLEGRVELGASGVWQRDTHPDQAWRVAWTATSTVGASYRFGGRSPRR